MKTFRTIFAKEFKRVFTDYRMYLALFLPGILIFVLYTVIGNVVSSSFLNKVYENITYRVAYTDNYGSVPELEGPLLSYALDQYVDTGASEKNNDCTFYPFSPSELTSYQEKTRNGEFDLLLVYSDGFEQSLSSSSEIKPNLTLYYDGSREESSHLYQVASALIQTVYDAYTTNLGNEGYIDPNLAPVDSEATQVLSFLFPMITISLLFSSVIALCPETIAGEKERGTLTSLLITPAPRSQIVLAKVACLSITSVLSGLCSFLGVALSLPKLMGGLSFSLPPATIVALLFLMVSALLFFVVLGTLVSAFAKTIKEANGFLGPFMGVALFLSLLPAMMDISSLGYSLIPFLNIASSMRLVIISSTIDYAFLGLTIGSNLLYSLGLVLVIARLFRSEKIVLPN